MIDSKLLKGCIRHLSGLYKNGNVAIRVGRHEVFFVADNHEVHTQVVIGTREHSDGFQRGYYIVRDFMNANSMTNGTTGLDVAELLQIDGKSLSIGSWQQVVYTFVNDEAHFMAIHDDDWEAHVDVPWGDVASFAQLYKTDPYDTLIYRRYVSISPKYGFSVTDGSSIVQMNRYKVKTWDRDLMFPLAALKAIKELGDYNVTLMAGDHVKWVFSNGIVIVKEGLALRYPNVKDIDKYLDKLTAVGSFPKKCPVSHIKGRNWKMILKESVMSFGQYPVNFEPNDESTSWRGVYDTSQIVKFIRKAKRKLELRVPVCNTEDALPLVLQGDGVRLMIMPGKEIG